MIKRIANSELFKRTLGTTTYGALFIWFILWGGLPLAVGVAVVTVMAAYEFYRMTSRRGYRPSYALGILTALLFVADAYLKADLLRPGLIAVLLVSLAWLGIAQFRQRAAIGPAESSAWSNWAITLGGALYTGGLLSYVIRLRDLPRGDALLLITALGAALCDIAAYLIGSRIGRHKLAPSISPRKTWEGAIAGAVAAILTVVIGCSVTGFGLLAGLAWGVILSIVQIAGDLAESILKRRTGVKDSGALIPAQGGILDVIDGFLFSVIVSFYYIIWVIRP